MIFGRIWVMTENDLKKKHSDSVISKKGVRDFVKANGRYVTQVDKMFYAVLDHRVKDIILKAISNNCSRRKLTHHEIH
jgi:3-oxoacyl-ACP reductase-like protein